MVLTWLHWTWIRLSLILRNYGNYPHFKISISLASFANLVMRARVALSSRLIASPQYLQGTVWVTTSSRIGSLFVLRHFGQSRSIRIKSKAVPDDMISDSV